MKGIYDLPPEGARPRFTIYDLPPKGARPRFTIYDLRLQYMLRAYFSSAFLFCLLHSADNVSFAKGSVWTAFFEFKFELSKVNP